MKSTILLGKSPPASSAHAYDLGIPASAAIAAGPIALAKETTSGLACAALA